MDYICKPQKASIYVNDKRKTIQQIKEETGCDAIINGGLYNMNAFKPVCHLKVDGRVLACDQYKYWGYAWNDCGLSLTTEYEEYNNYIACVCLVREGKAEEMYYGSALGGARPRTAIGTFSDGRVWMYAEPDNMTPEALQKLAIEVGMRDAVMLDGGGSTQCIFPKGRVTSSRKVHNYICLWADEQTNKEDNKMKIYLSPSAQPGNSYAAGNTNEQVQCNRIATAAKFALERCGFTVKKAPEGQGYKENVAESNAWGADIHIPIHTNAGGGYGTVIFVYGLTDTRLKYAMPIYNAVNSILLKPGARGVQAYPGLYEISNTTAPCVYVECEFHDESKKAEWIINHVSDIGEAICKGVCEGARIAYIEPEIEFDEEAAWAKAHGLNIDMDEKITGRQLTRALMEIATK